MKRKELRRIFICFSLLLFAAVAWTAPVPNTMQMNSMSVLVPVTQVQAPTSIILPQLTANDVITKCTGVVQNTSEGVRLGSAWCWYKIDYSFDEYDYVLEFDARLESGYAGDGFGVWFRGKWQNDRPYALGTQYEASGRLLLVNYPGTDGSVFYSKPYYCDYNWHHWQLYGLSLIHI